METYSDRREEKRYHIRGGAVANIVKKPFFLLKNKRHIKLGPITDISNKGMSIHYFSNRYIPDDNFDMSIGTSSGKIIIDRLKFKTVYDIEVGSMPNGKTIRRKAVKFMHISGYQAAWFACIIHNLKSRQDEYPESGSQDDKPEILNEIF